MKLTVLVNLVLCSTCWSWEAIPQIPSGHRTQYFVLKTDGGYKYGYDTGAESAAKQAADSANQVEGHYFYTSPKGGKFDLKYTSGVQGFVPEGYGKTLQPSVYLGTNLPPYPVAHYGHHRGNQAESGDSSYAFNIDTDSYKRTETSDARGNIKGSYSYTNEAGTHDISYVAGENSGFVATSGSLSKANGLPNSNNDWKSFTSPQVAGTIPTASETSPITTTNQIEEETQDDLADTGNSSYSFNIDTDEYKRTETSDAQGNVQGSFSYKSPAGTQDLSYVAGSSTGFVATGGSLSNPEEIAKHIPNSPENAQLLEDSNTSSEISSGDASYAFTIDTDEYKRRESSDAAGNVQGDYQYKNSAGNHDLSFVAGSATGFQPTGGSLSIAPGLNAAQLLQGQQELRPSNVVRLEAIPVAPANQIWGAEKAKVFTYLPPSNEKGKFGYIYEVHY